MFMIELNGTGWRYWLVTAALLTYGVVVDPIGFVLAIALTLVHLLHFVIMKRSVTAFPIQVRFWYLSLLLLAQVEGLGWIYWIPAIGTWAQVLFGYCAMARFVSLLPWNSCERFSFSLVSRTILARPVKGSIKQNIVAQK
ncbi:hypothetical protein JK628_04490 [Shewanella sp. KX20019]|uniref:hypothetical protein n=1 Tax=Shewanella sp. KX20019 TaxID=2803864 RepID=UPI00192619CC|nr:hypothetical protein [Shewanella sp. KX20019]QQX81136.1 hypothetical protein JK628_04490 [Shewanella sp. KX20019]